MNKIAHFIVNSKAATHVAVLLCVVMWGSQSVLAGGVSLSGGVGLLLFLAMGYLSVRVAREHSFNDAKNALPATLFFMGCAIAPQANLTYGDEVHFILFAIACYILLRTYRSRSAMGSYFLAFALVGVLCLITPSLLLTLPFLVLCGAFMESLHVRTFFASLWGLLLPYWVMAGVLFLTDRLGIVVPYFEQIGLGACNVFDVLVTTQQWLQFLWALLLALPGSVMVLLNRTMKLQTSAGFRLLIVSLMILFIAIWLFPICYPALFPCALLYSSLIGTTLFVGNNGRAKNIYLTVLLIFWLFSLGLHVWSSYMMR